MINFSYLFNNYDEFKNIFGMTEHNNGTKSRKNKILLAFHKSPAIREYVKDELHRSTIAEIDSMTMLKLFCLDVLSRRSGKYYSLRLNGHTFWSNKYSTDGRFGICEDGDLTKIKYILHNNDTEKPHKMKPGKLFRALIDEHPVASELFCEQVKTWICEELSVGWLAYTASKLKDYTLHVDKDFKAIYNGTEMCYGDFGSCMARDSRKRQWEFYENSVDAHAAYLTNKDNLIVARCIIFDEVEDEEGNTYRYAERQYSTSCDELLKHILVHKLIAGGRIDLYKKPGAGCWDTHAIVDIHGNSMSDKNFSIKCCLAPGDTLSFQDTFQYYNSGCEVAWNDGDFDYDYRLSTTDRTLSGGNDEWDEYHEEWCESTVTCHYHGDEIAVSTDDLDDFYRIGGEYYHMDDVSFCEYCDEPYIDGVYSEITDSCYCCESCKEQAEDDWKRENWSFSEYDCDYFEEDDLTTWMTYDCGEYVVESISKESIDRLESNDEAALIGGKYFDIRSMGVAEAVARIVEYLDR